MILNFSHGNHGIKILKYIFTWGNMLGGSIPPNKSPAPWLFLSWVLLWGMVHSLSTVVTRGYATPVTSNALFGRHNPKFSQNNTRGSHLKAFISPQIKTILWLSAVVPTNVVRVSEPTECTLKLSIWIFTPLPDGGEKTQNPSFDILNLGFRKHVSLYNRRFFR
jgi:hypothetical protein